MSEQPPEPTIADVLVRLELLAGEVRGELTNLDRGLDNIEGKVDTIYERQENLAARMEILIDSYGTFRRAYLRDHPRQETT